MDHRRLFTLLQWGAGLALLGLGIMNMISPTLAGIPLLLAGIALIACSHSVVDRFIQTMEARAHVSPRKSRRHA